MREIKFRGKRVTNGEWVYGYYVQYEHMGNVKHIIVTSWSQVCVSSYDVRGYQVIPETVGQYTGLTDRDGIKIYEGDVLRNVDNPIVDHLPFKVIWSKHHGAWFWWDEVGTDHLYQSVTNGCEVIGNIHDNAELMGVKK